MLKGTRINSLIRAEDESGRAYIELEDFLGMFTWLENRRYVCRVALEPELNDHTKLNKLANLIEPNQTLRKKLTSFYDEVEIFSI
ncbi:hypothetical protein C2S52_023147 [Perilla frutescens var. hirtella]|nr:hypothetical protein C2S52_023147 [Perilla frutescens var. hirtella]KAH6761198.1 hypothetical protein C2S51_018147 [Perilla frutescens var. frutescens]